MNAFSQMWSRRAALRWATGTGAALCGAAVAARTSRRTAAQASIEVLLDEPIGVIKPGLHGHFVEHLGAVVYDGVWVGPDSAIANTDGIRQTVIDHMKGLGPVVVRWPGGCFADVYHWRDGIGPRGERPRRFGRWREQTEPNSFGSHEFLRFCELTGTVPYMAGNVGTGSPREFQSWVEYCNAPAGTTSLADERAGNGRTEPFGVRHWGVGNESWGCGGNFTPEEYCQAYKHFTTWMPSYGVPLYLIAAGPNGNNADWTRRFFQEWRTDGRTDIQGWAPHYYCGTTGHALQFSQDQWYEMLHRANAMERLIADQWEILGEYDSQHAIKLTIDEWGTWHPSGTEVNPAHELEQMSTLRDALVAGLTLDTFHRHADKIDMGNIAQLVNCLQSLFLADGDRFVATPNYYAFLMNTPHQNATAVRMETQCEDVAFRVRDREERLFRVQGSASLRDKKSGTITLVHTHATEPIEVIVTLRGGSARTVRLTTLTAPELNAHNTFEAPERVVPSTRALDLEGPTLRLELPPASLNRLSFELG